MSIQNQSLETLSNIKGATEYTEIWDLFAILDKFEIAGSNSETHRDTATSQLLREDIVIHSGESSKHIIIENASGVTEDNQFIL